MGSFVFPFIYIFNVDVYFQPLNAAGKLEEILPSLLFVCQEIFPLMYKYRFYDPYAREKMGVCSDCVSLL